MDSRTICTGCGAPRAQWQADAGVATEGGTFCCGDCASAATCICAERAPTKDEIRDDADSARFVQSLQHQTDTMTTDDYDRGLVKRPTSGDFSHD